MNYKNKTIIAALLVLAITIPTALAVERLTTNDNAFLIVSPPHANDGDTIDIYGQFVFDELYAKVNVIITRPNDGSMIYATTTWLNGDGTINLTVRTDAEIFAIDGVYTVTATSIGKTQNTTVWTVFDYSQYMPE